MNQFDRKTYYYDLPEELIAQNPVLPRDEARLLVYNRNNKNIEHKIFKDVLDYLNEGDVLVLNNTRVLPARLFGVKQETNAKIEVLLHKRHSLTEWEVLLRPGKRCKIGTKVTIGDDLYFEVIADGEDGVKVVNFTYEGGTFEEKLIKYGSMPLPQYIKHSTSNPEDYQTVYAKQEGSSAAPTAGLHFTSELLEKIKAKGVEIVEVLLHVGLGTFRPVKDDNILNHKMHSEFFEVSEEASQRLNKAKQEGKRIIAVGTTSVRVLESASVLGDENKYDGDINSPSYANKNARISSGSGETSIFIYPGYKFKMVDALITNFHLPESTLIMLVSAFCGIDNTLEMYNTAVKEKYRFFSFGDAMFIE